MEKSQLLVDFLKNERIGAPYINTFSVEEPQ
jgi:hypothetical protein